jgi:hypothetical protein
MMPLSIRSLDLPMNRFIQLTIAIIIGVALAACSPEESTADSSKEQKQKAMPKQAESGSIPSLPLPRFESNIVSSLGQSLSQSALDDLKASMAMVPDLQNKNASSEQYLIARGDPGSEVVSAAVRLDGNHVLAIDYTLSSLKHQAQERQQKLLKNYEKTGGHTISQLTPSLDSIEVPVSDYQHRTDHNLHAASFEAGGVIRVILFDTTRVNAESLMPTVKSLPPGLLETAKRALKTQRALHEGKETK